MVIESGLPLYYLFAQKLVALLILFIFQDQSILTIVDIITFSVIMSLNSGGRSTIG